jgi:hypothetical protein
MKMLVAKLLVGIFSLGLCVNISAEEWKSYKFIHKPSGTNNYTVSTSEDTIKLEKGDSVTFVNSISSHRDDTWLNIKIIMDVIYDKTMKYHHSDDLNRHVVLQNFATFFGPCHIEIGASGHPQQTTWILCNAKITRANESLSKNVTGYSLVLPESKDTNYNLVLESSTDLVSWTADTTGTKTPSDKKRFYRLRAVKE